MNPIQKAWLKVLSPVVTLVNDKLAKRSGMVGKLARFFAFGPRQFGFHPINKGIAFCNRITIQGMGIALHNYSFIKHINFGGYIGARPFAFMSLLGKMMIFSVAMIFLIPREFQYEQGTNLQMLTKKGIPVPYNALNDRVSAHYTEINSLYTHQMSNFAGNQAQALREKWDRTSDKERKLRFARPGYKYIEPHSKAK